MSGASPLWHPFTQHQTAEPPIKIVGASGCRLYDELGNFYLDAISSWWTNLHGHGHSYLVNAIANQASNLDHVMFAGFTHQPAEDLATLLTTHPPHTHLKKVFFSDSGSTAVEVALKMVLQRAINRGESQRNVIVSFEGAYHGDTFGAMAVGRGSGFFEVFDVPVPRVQLLPFPDTWHNDPDVRHKEIAALRAAEQLFEAQHHTIAGLIIEPLLQAAGGMRMCRPQFLQQLCELAQQYAIPVILDEVATGFYRTGTLFAFMQAGIKPDIICLAKGLSGGIMPLAATITTEEIFNDFLDNSFGKALIHGHSYTANPIACMSGITSFRMLHSHGTRYQISMLSAWNKEFIAKTTTLPQTQQQFFGNIRSLGTVLAFNVPVGDSRYGTTTSNVLKNIFLKHYINVRPLGSVVYIMPPYCTTENEHRFITNAFLEVANTWHR